MEFHCSLERRILQVSLLVILFLSGSVPAEAGSIPQNGDVPEDADKGWLLQRGGYAQTCQRGWACLWYETCVQKRPIATCNFLLSGHSMLCIRQKIKKVKAKCEQEGLYRLLSWKYFESHLATLISAHVNFPFC